MSIYDVVVIGAGVSGCAVARELARRERRIAVLEKASDVCEGTSKANSGIVHAGHDAVPGTLKARLNVQGNEKMEALSKELDFPFRRNGSLVLCFEEEGKPELVKLLRRGEENGVKDLRILTPEQVWELEPNVSREVVAALYAPTGGIVCPFGLNLALAENAVENGVEFFLNHPVESVERIKRPENAWQEKEEKAAEEQKKAEEEKTAEAENGGETARGDMIYRIRAGEETFFARSVVNAAGVYADVLHNMVSGRKMKIVPRKGEYCLMDKNMGSVVNSTVFQLPSSLGKGVLVTPTVHGNLLAGPTAQDIPDREGVNTTAPGLAKVMDLGSRSVPGLSSRQVITSFAGLRAHGGYCGEEGAEDFMIGEVQDAPGFFDVAGIESPGLTCAPAIGEYVAQIVQERYPAPVREDFISRRRGIPNMALADEQTRQELVASDPAYANVICRCELVTEGEIVNAIHRPLGAVTLDGIKRRTRAGMGRCQAGFCSPKTAAILARELNMDLGEITKAGGESVLLTGYTKGYKEEERGRQE